MNFTITISSISQDELQLITSLLSALVPAKTTVEANPGREQDQSERDADESDSPATPESTREKGLGLFVCWAHFLGLKVRRSGPGEPGTFIVGTGAKEWPVEVICSKRPRITLRKQWAQPENLWLAYVWVEEGAISLMRYREAEARLEGAAFTEDGFYTKALSPSRKQDLAAFRKSLDISEECAITTLMETGAFGSESDARQYFRENGLPGVGR